ncbi:DNA translocase FtsK [Oceanicoccus sp. KOV_DT_Chl]|uniref:DNA translocase FtsK n=1 Tax=Oceanicoccus sp. KOV_DT_Chl TaxID=1904639 RepID=UPI000C7CB9AE|nr:DNA translocase FtsK [Oceanicoccus sp. KOV_DT_Chl]
MPDKTANNPAVEKFVPRLREGALIGFVAVFIYLLMALSSYDRADPGWSRTGTGEPVMNAGGPTGAWLADIFLSMFGYMAYLFPLMVGYRAWILFRQRYQPQRFDWASFSIRIIGLVIVMVASTSLAMIGDNGDSGLPFGAGGALGQSVGAAMVASFSLIGARLILLALFLFGMTIFTDLSWLKLMDQIGALTLRGLNRSYLYLTRYWQQRKEQRSLKKVQQERKVVIAQQVEKEKTRERPKILPLPKKAEKSVRSEREKQQPLFNAPVVGTLPNLELLDPANDTHRKGFSEEALEALSKLLEHKLKDFGVVAEVKEVLPGPVVTRFEIQPGTGVKVSKITNLAKDIARSLAVISVRVVEVIPGKSVVGIEIPNEDRAIVNYRDVLSSKVYDDSKSPLTLALGHDISGEPIVADLAKMPHLLVAGTTGSGKSVGVNAMLLSLLYKSTPQQVRLILVDPKMLELSVYDGIPHLLTPVITDMKDAANGLRWCVAEMERRYKLMSAMGVRNLAGFNRKITDAIESGNPILDPLWVKEEVYQAGEEEPTAPALETLPSIVVVIDEFADMIMVVGKKVEELIARIAQKARAAGIHLILATQRPSVDVITGLIKANVPTRIAFQVSSRVDSRTILDQGGAEQLLGHGDMLYLPPGTSLPLRVHGAFVSDEEVHRVVADWKRRGEPNYIVGLIDEGASGPAIPGFTEGGNDGDSESDALYDEAVNYVIQSRRASISSVQRKLRIGYNRAARLIEAMEAAGVVTEMGTNGSREVLAPASFE